MYNVGQMIHDTTNNRPIIFGGINLNTEDGSSITRFVTESGELADYDQPPFEFNEYRLPNNEIYFGTFIKDLALEGQFFGTFHDEIVNYSEEIKKAFADVRKHICGNSACVEHGHFLGLEHVCAFDDTHICQHVHDNKCLLSGIDCNGHTCKYDFETVMKMKSDPTKLADFGTRRAHKCH